MAEPATILGIKELDDGDALPLAVTSLLPFYFRPFIQLRVVLLIFCLQ